MKVRVDGVVVLFNPQKSVLNNIQSYIDYVDELYVVDNSEVIDLSLIEKIKKLEKVNYINNNGNKGIANALNVGAKRALENGAMWLLTMDQDSIFIDNNLKKLIEYTKKQDYKNIGIISPLHITPIMDKPKVDVEKMYTVMTSGNFISLYAYEKVGGYKDYYFIDVVDWEYCLNLNLHNFDVIRLNYVFLDHNLGDSTTHINLFGKKVVTLNHNKIRKYYIIRNKLLVIKQYYKNYPKYCYGVLRSIFYDFKDVILYEQYKINKLKYMFRGVFDFLFNRLGKYNGK